MMADLGFPRGRPVASAAAEKRRLEGFCIVRIGLFSVYQASRCDATDLLGKARGLKPTAAFKPPLHGAKNPRNYFKNGSFCFYNASVNAAPCFVFGEEAPERMAVSSPLRHPLQRHLAKSRSNALLTLGLVSVIIFMFSERTALAQLATGSGPMVGWETNGPAVFRLYFQSTQALPGPALSFRPPPDDLPPEVRRVMLMLEMVANVTVITNTTGVFDHYLPESLNNAVWTNFIAHTNGGSMAVWSVRSRTPDWPVRPALVRWNPNSLVWGMKGLTALAPFWEGEGAPGGAPITALTRRHGYTRGHSMGPDGFRTDLRGVRVWFLTTQNHLVQTRITRHVVRTVETSHRDYTLFLFSSDLPESIEPMRVGRMGEIFGLSHVRYPYCADTPILIFRTEQGGNVSAGVPGFTLDTMKMGDSGSANMLPLPDELVFLDGRTTSGPSPEMQADMDQLCRLEGLDPARYQLQFADLSRYPVY